MPRLSRTDATAQDDIKDIVHQVHGGSWCIDTWDPDCVIVQRTETNSHRMRATWIENLDLCWLRLVLRTGFQQLRDTKCVLVMCGKDKGLVGWRLSIESVQVASCCVACVPIPCAFSLQLQALEV